MHSQTTETVRLPDGDGGGQITVHPALRSKLPLKRKVRNGRKMRSKHKPIESVNNNLNSPNKSKISPKKKKRVSAAVGAEENRKKTGDTAAVIEIPPSKVKKSSQSAQPKKKKKKREVIDYSSAQVDGEGKKGLINAEVLHNPVTPDADPVGKVQNWLMKSQPSFPKSKSTPERLTDKNRSPHKRPTIKPRTEKSKSHSVGHIPGEKEKVRLQVVYKPPFKFSVKLKKPEKTVVVERAVTKNPERKTPRTGVLVRTVREKPTKPKPTPDTVNLGMVSGPLVVSSTVIPTASTAAATPLAVHTTTSPLQVNAPTNATVEIDSNIHTVQSDMEVLLSESEFLFSD